GVRIRVAAPTAAREDGPVMLGGIGQRGQALVTRGEPGIGKSQLLSVAARADGGVVITEAGSHERAAGLVYIAAFALEQFADSFAADVPADLAAFMADS